MDVNEYCSNCRKSEQQMLMLSCIHDLCINCAANSFAQQVHIRKQNPEIFMCEFCGQETILDITTTTQLSNISKSFIKTPNVQKMTPQRVPQQPKKPAGPLTSKKTVSSPSPSISSPGPMPSASKKMVYFCGEHSEQQLSYYCFYCAQTICPECAIHGRHKDHDVKLIKKALGTVKESYLKVVDQVAQGQNTINGYKEHFLKAIKETNQSSNAQKNFVAREFDVIRASLALKEKELAKNIDELNKKNVAMLTKFLESLNQHYEEIGKVKKSIESILRKDEVLIFEEFKKLEDFQLETQQIRQKSDDISGELMFLNSVEMQQWLKNINDLIKDTKQSITKQYVCSRSQQTQKAHYGNINSLAHSRGREEDSFS